MDPLIGNNDMHGHQQFLARRLRADVHWVEDMTPPASPNDIALALVDVTVNYLAQSVPANGQRLWDEAWAEVRRRAT